MMYTTANSREAREMKRNGRDADRARVDDALCLVHSIDDGSHSEMSCPESRVILTLGDVTRDATRRDPSCSSPPSVAFTI